MMLVDVIMEDIQLLITIKEKLSNLRKDQEI